MTHTKPSGIKIKGKISFQDKSKYIESSIKFQPHTTPVSFLIPNLYHFVNQTPPKMLSKSNLHNTKTKEWNSTHII